MLIPLGMQVMVGLMETILRELFSILLLLMLAQRIVMLGFLDAKI